MTKKKQLFFMSYDPQSHTQIQPLVYSEDVWRQTHILELTVREQNKQWLEVCAAQQRRLIEGRETENFLACRSNKHALRRAFQAFKKPKERMETHLRNLSNKS